MGQLISLIYISINDIAYSYILAKERIKKRIVPRIISEADSDTQIKDNFMTSPQTVVTRLPFASFTASFQKNQQRSWH